MTRSSVISRCIFVLAGLSACSKSSDSPNAGSIQFAKARLPGGGTDGLECRATRPPLCEWVDSVEAVVVARIVSIEARRVPVVVKTNTGTTLLESEQECDQALGPALVLTLEPLDILRGAVSGITITVYVGSDALGRWLPRPVYDEEGSLTWFGGASSDEEMLAVNSVVGVGISRYPGRDEWTLGRELPFTFAPDGNPVFAETCTTNLPPAVEATATYAEFSAAVRGCPESDGTALASARAWFTPELAFAAVCSQVTTPVGYCTGDRGCRYPAEVCSENRCIANPAHQPDSAPNDAGAMPEQGADN